MLNDSFFVEEENSINYISGSASAPLMINLVGNIPLCTLLNSKFVSIKIFPFYLKADA